MRRWFRYSLLVIPVVLALVYMLVLHTGWGLSLTLRFASLYLPGSLTVTDTSGTLAGPLTLTGIHYRQDKLKLSVESIQLNWHSFALLSGRLSISELLIQQVDIEIADADRQEAAAPQNIVLPLVVDIEQAQLEGLRIHQAGSDKPLVIDTVRLAASATAQDIQLRELLVNGYHVQLHSTGKLSLAPGFPLHLQVGFTYSLPDIPAVQGKGSLQGDLQEMRLQQDLAGPLAARLDMTAVTIDTNLQWQADVKIEKLNPAHFNESWPDIAIEGQLNPAGNLSQFSLAGALQLDERQTGHAEISLSAQSDYLLADYQFEVGGEFVGIDLPAAEFRFKGTGTHNHITIPQLTMTTLQGNITGDAKVAWQPKLLINSDLAISNIETAWLHHDWPGELDARLSIRSIQQDAATRIKFSLSQVQGNLRDHPLAGRAHGEWYGNGLLLNDMELTVGEGRLHASGSLAEKLDLKFKISAEDMNHLLPDSGGKLKLQGHLRGSRAKPSLAFQVNAEKLQYMSYSAEQLVIDADLGLSAQDRFYLDLQAVDVGIPAGQWQSLKVQLNGTTGTHELTIDARNKLATLQADIEGALSTWQWKGTLRDFRISQSDIGNWQLRAPAQFTLSQSASTVNPLCLEQAAAYLCAELRWQEQNPAATLDGRQIPLGLLNTWIPADIRTGGFLNVKGGLHGKDTRHITAYLEVTSVGETVFIESDEASERLSLGASSLQATVDNKGLNAKMDVSFVPDGGIDAQLEAPGWTLVNGIQRNQPLKGQLMVEKLPAELVTHFSPELVRAKGHIEADISFNGTLGEPRMAGNARWHDGSMVIPEIGISITNISAALASARANIVKFEVAARSGEGEVRLSGQTRLDPAQGWPTQAKLTSNKLEIMNIAEAYVIVDSDIDLALQGSTIDITGDVAIPRARLRPRALPEGTETLSEDVMIISEKEAAETKTPWLITSRIRVKMGELVDFDGFGVSGKLRGDLLISDKPERPAVGQGEVNIADGIYRLRGQDLSIRRGRLLFANSFINNPGIDVEATREIETVLVGVRIKGTLKEPRLTVFSEPAMSETDALSYLIFGHTLTQGTSEESESVRNTAAAMGFFAGDILARDIGGSLGLDELRVDVGETTEKTSLVMGKYLSSKLYVRYFTGIVESSNIVQLRYQVSPRVQIQTEGGYRGSQSVTGGDIFFTIEY